jgi:hypothetical protein
MGIVEPEIMAPLAIEVPKQKFPDLLQPSHNLPSSNFWEGKFS